MRNRRADLSSPKGEVKSRYYNVRSINGPEEEILTVPEASLEMPCPESGRSGIFSLFESLPFARKRTHSAEPLACLVAPVLVFVFCHGLDY